MWTFNYQVFDYFWHRNCLFCSKLYIKIFNFEEHDMFYLIKLPLYNVLRLRDDICVIKTDKTLVWGISFFNV